MELNSYLPFWSSLDPSQRTLLEQAAQERHFRRGETLHGGTENCAGLMLVLRGQLRVYTISDEGKELTLYRLLPRDMCLFSASCIMQSIQFDIMVMAEQDTDVLQIPADTYKYLMETSAAVANYTNELMATRFSDVMWLLDQLLNKKLDTRLAAFLLEECLLEGETDTLSLTHEQIANHLGSVREVVTRMLKYFQNEGLVQLRRGSIRILDPVRLRELASVSLR